METTGRQILIAILLFSAIIAGTFSMIGTYVPADDSNFTDFNRSINKFRTIKGTSDTIASNMETAEPTNEGVEGIVSGLWDISFGAVQTMWNAITTIGTVISDTGTLLDLPDWFTGLIITVISVTLAFAIIASVRKYNV